MEGGKKFWQDKQFIFGAVIGLIVIMMIALVFVAVKISINKLTSNSSVDTAPAEQNFSADGPETDSITNPAINTFEMKKDAKICTEGGKPVVYLFSASWCPHCKWINDTYNKVVAEYEKAGKIKAYHFDAETGDNLLTSEVESQMTDGAKSAYEEFNPEGSIPTFVFGCKYFRIGNGYESEDSLANEEKEFRTVIEDIIK